MFDNLGDKVIEMIIDWLKGLVDTFISILTNFLFNYDGLAGFALTAYNLFVFLGGLLLVVVCLGKVITQLLSEAEGSQEANVWWTIVQSLKAGALLLLMPFIISFTMNNVVKPIGEYFITEMGNVTNNQIETMIESEAFTEVFKSIMSVALVWFFVLVVLGFFVIKMFVIQAQLLMDEILSPLVAISVVTENYNFLDNWWRDILTHTITLITLTLSMLLFTEALTMDSATIWSKLPALVGSGALVVTGPSLIKSIWFSSGAGRAGQGVARTAMQYVMHKG